MIFFVFYLRYYKHGFVHRVALFVSTRATIELHPECFSEVPHFGSSKHVLLNPKKNDAEKK